MQVKDSCTVYKWYSIDLSHFPFPPLPTSSTGITPGCGGSDSIFVRTWRRGPGRHEDFLGFHWEGGKASNIYIYIYVNGFHMSSWDFMGGSSPFDVFKHGSSMDWVELREDPLSGSSMVFPSSNSGGLVVSSLKNMSWSIEIILPGH